MNSTVKRLLFGSLFAALIITACGAPAQQVLQPTQKGAYGFEGPAMGGGGAPQESFAAPAPGYPAANDAARAAEQPGAPASERLVIQTADVSIVVSDVKARIQAIEDMAAEMGGFVVSINVYETYTNDGQKVPEGQIVVRVPDEKLGAALEQIKHDTVEVLNETRSGQDVTSQYTDLQSQLTAKQAAEAQLLKIMEGAEKTEDVLAVYAQLQQIQSEIEVLKGQIKYYEESASLSAISVRIVAEETVKPIEIGGWKPEGVARDAIQSLIYFWQDFVDFLIRFFLYTLPVLVTIGIPLFLAFLLVRWITRRTRKPGAAPAPAKPAKK
jgi:hypothetical protein